MSESQAAQREAASALQRKAAGARSQASHIIQSLWFLEGNQLSPPSAAVLSSFNIVSVLVAALFLQSGSERRLYGGKWRIPWEDTWREVSGLIEWYRVLWFAVNLVLMGAQPWLTGFN